MPFRLNGGSHLSVRTKCEAVFLLSLLSCLGCAIRPKDVVGRYFTMDSDFHGVAVDINEDGTYALYANNAGGMRGRWRLNSHQFFSTGIELDSNEYRLARRGYGVLCLELRRDYEYWCKVSK